MKKKTCFSNLKTGTNVYLTGAAGAGKTYVLNQYITYLQKHNVGIGITASTGIAATHLGGMTIHAWSGIGIKDVLTDWDIDTLTQRQPLVKRFERTNVLLIDEVSMLRPEILDMIDQVSRAMKRVDESFGGMQVVLCGDFFQLPPVVRGGRGNNESELFADSAQSWSDGDFRVCYLSEQYRQEGGKLLDILNDIRDGEMSSASQEALESRMHPSTKGSIKGSTKSSKKSSKKDSVESYSDGAIILHTHNANVDERNKKELAKLDTDVASFEMTSSGRAHLVESLTKNVLAPQELELKVGARVMFVKNSPTQEYVNGTLGEVMNLDGAFPLIKTNDGREIIAHPVSWEVTDDGKVLASVSQLPLRLAWAITVHKSQGMSLDSVEVDLSAAFTPGQGYVALSRARTLEGLTLHGLNSTALKVHPYVSERDGVLRDISKQLEKVFTNFSPTKISDLHEAFIQDVGRDYSEVAATQTIPTHLKTRALLEEKPSLEDMAELRGLTKGTIISHLEKLKEVGDEDIFAYLRPKKIMLSAIEKAFIKSFKKSKDMKLAPVHKILKGKYGYEELRLARLFVDLSTGE